MFKKLVSLISLFLMMVSLVGCRQVSSPAPSSAASLWNLDYGTVSYDRNGNQLWVARYNGPGNAFDEANAIVVDSAGNTYVTGGSMGSGNGTRYDYDTVKYDKNGKQLWAARYHGPGYGDDIANAVAVDAGGNIYVTGQSTGSENNLDYTTVKYDTNGGQLWVARYQGPAASDDWPSRVAVDEAGNVYVTGWSTGTRVRYGDYTLRDYTTIKYDSSGKQLWIARYSGPENADNGASDLAVDASGNVYVTGESGVSDTDREYATVKYDTNGNQLWAARYHGPGTALVELVQ